MICALMQRPETLASAPQQSGEDRNRAALRVLIRLLRRRFLPSPDSAWNNICEDSLARCASWHGVATLVCQVVGEGGVVPQTAIQKLNTAGRAESARACLLAAELATVFEILRQNNIDALALKGPAVSLLAYQQPASRGLSDLDVLVPPKDLPHAIRLLEQRGYHQVRSYSAQNKDQRDVCLYRHEDGILLELHWALYVPSIHVVADVPGVWNRKQTVSIANHPIATLGMEDTFLYLCIHGAVHRWSRLKWICDIASFLASSGGIRWDEVQSRANSANCRRILAVGVEVAARLFGVPVPCDMASAYAHDKAVARVAERVINELTEGDRIRRVGEDLSHPLEYRERLQDRILVLGSKLNGKWRPTTADEDSHRLLLRFRPIRFLIRPVRLIRTYGVRWLRAVVSSSLVTCAIECKLFEIA